MSSLGLWIYIHTVQFRRYIAFVSELRLRWDWGLQVRETIATYFARTVGKGTYCKGGFQLPVLQEEMHGAVQCRRMAPVSADQ
jgi:hypothetical protein